MTTSTASKETEDVVLGTVAAFLDSFCDREFERTLPSIAADVRAIGSDAAERAYGIDEFRAGLDRERESLPIPVKGGITAAYVRVHAQTAWVETDVNLAVQTEPVPYFVPPLRWTWFLRRGEAPDTWLIEHYHCSVAWGGPPDQDYESVPRAEIDAQRRALELLIAERTTELRRKNEQLEEALAALREAQDRLRTLAEEQARHRIADDLHDELGSRAGAVGLQLELAARSLEGSDDARQRLAAAAEATHWLAADVREAVWLVDSGHDTAAALGERMESIAFESLGTCPHTVRVVGSDSPPPLPFAFRRHALLAFREAVHNAARHATDCAVDVVIEWDGEVFGFEVSDHGGGFDVDSLDVSGSHSGRGLRTMRERARALEGRFEVSSTPGNGTQVRFEAPIPAADEGGRAPSESGAASV